MCTVSAIHSVVDLHHSPTVATHACFYQGQLNKYRSNCLTAAKYARDACFTNCGAPVTLEATTSSAAATPAKRRLEDIEHQFKQDWEAKLESLNRRGSKKQRFFGRFPDLN